MGIDYLLDRPNNGDRTLSNSIQTGLNSSQPTRFVFATTRDNNGNWSLFGEIELLPWYMQLLPSTNDNPKPRPFAALLALSQQLQKLSNSPQPKLESKQQFWTQINTYINNDVNNRTILKSKRTRLQPLTAFSYYLSQMWLHPIIDFSIPPKQVYQTIPAWKLLEDKQTLSPNLPLRVAPLATTEGTSATQWLTISLFPHQIAIIAPGGYEEAGTGQNNEDNFELPAAMRYWRNQDNPDNTRGVLTGGKAHAYMTHHYLNNRMVIPIPDLWMIGLAIILGKIASLYLSNNPEQNRKYLILITISYATISLISLQLYISSAAILLPWLLPTITFWFYVLSAVTKKRLNQ